MNHATQEARLVRRVAAILENLLPGRGMVDGGSVDRDRGASSEIPCSGLLRDISPPERSQAIDTDTTAA